jgi:spore germination protein KB
MLYPYLNNKSEALKSAMGMVLFVGFFVTALMVVTIGVFGDLFTSQQTFPVVILARYIEYASMFERLELYLVIVWIAAALVKLAIFLHTSCIAATSTLGLKTYRPTIIPIAFICILTAQFLFSTYLQLIEFITGIFPIIMGIFALMLPVLILGVAVIRNKGEGEQPVAGK